MKVSHILKEKGATYASISPDHPLSVAIEAMVEKKIGSLIVMEGGRIVGIVSERDVMRAVHDHGGGFSSLHVNDVMTPDVIVCKQDDSLDEAMSLMTDNPSRKSIRHLPVMDGESLVGIISMRDIVKALLTEIRFENRLLKHYIKNWPEEEAL